MAEQNIMKIDGKEIDVSKVDINILRKILKERKGEGRGSAFKADVQAEAESIKNKLIAKLPKGKVVISWGDKDKDGKDRGFHFSVNSLRGPRPIDPNKPPKAKKEPKKEPKK